MDKNSSKPAVVGIGADVELVRGWKVYTTLIKIEEQKLLVFGVLQLCTRWYAVVCMYVMVSIELSLSNYLSLSLTVFFSLLLSLTGKYESSFSVVPFSLSIGPRGSGNLSVEKFRFFTEFLFDNFLIF